MNRGIKILFLSLFVGAGAYVTAYLIRQKNLLANTGFDVKKASVSLQSLSLVNINLITTVKNNSDINFQIYKQDFDIYLGTNKVSNVTNDQKITLNSNTSADTSYTIGVNPADIFSGVGQALKLSGGDISSIPITIKGRVSVTAGMLFINSFPVNYTFKVKDILG